MSEDNLTLKSLQSHLIKTVIGSVVAALVTAVIMGFSFYYKTSSSLEVLTKEQTETRELVNKHTEQLNKNTQSSSVSDVQIKNLEARFSSMEKTQQDMLKILIEINASQKTLVKNNR